jgi:hypothetical protein
MILVKPPLPEVEVSPVVEANLEVNPNEGKYSMP